MFIFFFYLRVFFIVWEKSLLSQCARSEKCFSELSDERAFIFAGLWIGSFGETKVSLQIFNLITCLVNFLY